MIARYRKYKFLFSVLVDRDFRKKYQQTVLGLFWSVLSPLFTVLVQALVFTYLFARSQEYFVVYMFIGNVVWKFFSDATKGGMTSIESNAAIITKIRVPMYLFVLSANASCLINMALTFGLLMIFCYAYAVPFTWRYFLCVYPLTCLIFFNIGVSLFLSGIYVFFKDTRYFYDVFTTLLHYLSAIFYPVSRFPDHIAWLFNLNPVYTYISYMRKLILYQQIPSLQHALLCLSYTGLALGIGGWMYYRNHRKYVYQL
jgi:ABC-2 type transport system permease protein